MPADVPRARSSVFRCQTREERETCCQQTLGIDMFVTNERMIILDTQPLLSSAGLDHMIHNDKKYSAEYSSVENCVEIQVSVMHQMDCKFACNMW